MSDEFKVEPTLGFQVYYNEESQVFLIVQPQPGLECNEVKLSAIEAMDLADYIQSNF